jgi:hypothetical protein
MNQEQKAFIKKNKLVRCRICRIQSEYDFESNRIWHRDAAGTYWIEDKPYRRKR